MNIHFLQKIAIAILTIIIAASQPASAFQAIQVESALIAVPVIISDSQGRLVPGLKADSFMLFQDGIQEKISLFLSSEEPFKIALLLDTSKSSTTVLNKIKSAAQQFLLQMSPRDLAMVVCFDSEVRILCPFSSDRAELKKAIDRAVAAGSTTKLRDAIQKISSRFRSISGRKAIVLLTDGDDYDSAVSAMELRDEIVSSGTMIYSLFYDVDFREWMRELFGKHPGAKNKVNQDWEKRKENAAQYLQEISELSGGRFYKSKVTELDKVFRQISEELHSQYLIGFYPDKSKLDGNLHSLVVKVDRPDITIRSRRSYRKIANDK
jgi:Ca-activated chloride channel homolog